MKAYIKSLGILFSSAALACLLPACITTAEKPHEYEFGDEDEEVTQLPHSRPESFESGGGLGNMPQSR